MTLDLPRHPVLGEETPCDRCTHFGKCATELLACSAFLKFVNGGRWRAAAREPSAEQFAAIYNSGRSRDDDALAELRGRMRRTRDARGTRIGRKRRTMEAACQQ